MKLRSNSRAAGCAAVALIVAACGGAGGPAGDTAVLGDSAVAPAPAPSSSTSPAPAPAPAPAATPAPAPADLRDDRNALRLASAMMESTALSLSDGASKWTGAPFRARSRTDINGCRTATFVNADGVPGVGDRLEVRATACTQAIEQGSWSQTQTLRATLAAISDPQLPEAGAWTVTEETSVEGTLAWDVPVGENGMRFTGQGRYTRSRTVRVEHAADGSQRDTQTRRVTATGSDTLGAFDFTVESDFVCTFAAGQTRGSCVTGTVTLKGVLAGRPADATLAPAGASPPEFTITQGGQTVRVRRNLGTGDTALLTASGATLVTSLIDLISGYH